MCDCSGRTYSSTEVFTVVAVNMTEFVQYYLLFLFAQFESANPHYGGQWGWARSSDLRVVLTPTVGVSKVFWGCLKKKCCPPLWGTVGVSTDPHRKCWPRALTPIQNWPLYIPTLIHVDVTVTGGVQCEAFMHCILRNFHFICKYFL